MKKLVSDGVLVQRQQEYCTQFVVHGPILNLNSKKISTPISAFRPRRWSGKIVMKNLK